MSYHPSNSFFPQPGLLFPFRRLPSDADICPDCYWVGSLDCHFLVEIKSGFPLNHTEAPKSEALFAGGSTATKKILVDINVFCWGHQNGFGCPFGRGVMFLSPRGHGRAHPRLRGEWPVPRHKEPLREPRAPGGGGLAAQGRHQAAGFRKAPVFVCGFTADIDVLRVFGR